MFSVCEHDLAQKCLWTALTCLEVGPELRELFLPLRIGNPLYVLAVRHCTGCEMMKVSGRHAPLPLCPPHTVPSLCPCLGRSCQITTGFSLRCVGLSAWRLLPLCSPSWSIPCKRPFPGLLAFMLLYFFCSLHSPASPVLDISVCFPG